MKWLFLVLIVLTLSSCASGTASGGAGAEVGLPGPAAWQGALADRMKLMALPPATPALKRLRGRTPLVHVTRAADPDAVAEPDYELAVFDDGTIVYEGRRCVRVGGLVITRLGPDDVVHLQDLLTPLCVDLQHGGDDELCADPATLRVSCTKGREILRGSDHCRRDEPSSRRLEALRAAAIDALDLAPLLGEPTQRQACTAGARDLAPHELARTLAAT